MKNTVQSLKSIVENSSQTADDLRGFLTQLRGKSAGEMLGVLAQSGLIRATTQATLVTVVLLIAFSAGPYWIYGGPSKTKAAAKGSAPAAGANSGANSGSTAPGSTSGDGAAASGGAGASAGGGAGSTGDNAGAAAGKATSGAGGKAGGADLERAAKVLGLDETKSADPKSNPREKDLDSLLDKVK